MFRASLDASFQTIKTTGIGTGINTTPMIDPINNAKTALMKEIPHVKSIGIKIVIITIELSVQMIIARALPQGHEDCIQTVNLYPDDANAAPMRMMIPCWQPAGWSVPGNYFPHFDISFGKGTFKRFAMGDLCLAYGNFYMGVISYFTQMRTAHVIEYRTETEQEV